METQTTPATSRGRVLAYRIIAGVFGVFVLISNVAETGAATVTT